MGTEFGTGRFGGQQRTWPAGIWGLAHHFPSQGFPEVTRRDYFILSSLEAFKQVEMCFRKIISKKLSASKPAACLSALCLKCIRLSGSGIRLERARKQRDRK